VPERLLVVGDALLDQDLDGEADRLAPDAPVPVVRDTVTHSRPGGAGLAALLATRAGASVTLVAALGRDAASRELRGLLEDEGIEVVDLGRRTTPVKTRIRVAGRPVVRLDHGEGDGALHAVEAIDTVSAADVDAVLVADYGRGVPDHPHVRSRVEAWAGDRPVVWDPHPHGRGPVGRARLITPNRSEVQNAGLSVGTLGAVASAAVTLARRWQSQGVAVTLSGDGAVLGVPGRLPLAVPAPVVSAGDPCGAGDCFAAHAALALARGGVLTEAVTDAVSAASNFVAAGGVGSLPAPKDEPAGINRVDTVRRRGGTLVATSGCFDLLHAGHVAMLESARALGDALVVLLNSDASVQDLKGADRPIVGEHDRAALLRSLRCVDAVEVFDELTPERALERLRPQLFVKGDDYGAGGIPESALLEQWGGTVVVVPYVESRSTTRLIEEVRREP